MTGISLSICSTVPTRDGRIVENQNQDQNAESARDPRLHYSYRHPDTSSTWVVLNLTQAMNVTIKLIRIS